MRYHGNKRVFSFHEDKAKIKKVPEGDWFNYYEDGTTEGPFCSEFVAKYNIPVSFRSTTETRKIDVAPIVAPSTESHIEIRSVSGSL